MLGNKRTRGLLSLCFTLGDKMTLHPHPEIYPQNLSIQYLVVKGSKKNSKGEGGTIHISQKEEPFQSHKKLSAIWLNLTLHHRSLPLPKRTFLFPSIWSNSQYLWALIWKKTFCFVLAPSPHSRKRMMSTLLTISRFM